MARPAAVLTSQRLEPALHDRRPVRPHLVLVSNRGPYEYVLQDGRLSVRKGSGGLVTALGAIAHRPDVTWIASATTEAERQVARLGVPVDPSGLVLPHLRFVAHPRAAYQRFYAVFCNPILWFVQHDLWEALQRPVTPDLVYDAWFDGYLPVNEAMARAAAEEARRVARPLVLLHDYHFYLAPSYLRQRQPDLPILHFTHIPWPEPAQWAHLPLPIVQAICLGLLAADIVGFQTARDAENFLATCARYVPGARLDPTSGTVHYAGHQTRVRVYPISVDVGAIERLNRSETVAAHRARLRPLCRARTIVRVDRVDPSKNILKGLQAYQQVLREHPDLWGQVTLLACLVPSRSDLPEYAAYARAVHDLIAQINAAFTLPNDPDWRPISVFYENNYEQALAALSLADVVLITSHRDGMNLVAKEAPLVSLNAAVLVLSRQAGAYHELAEAALGIDPADTHDIAQALWQALQMPTVERRQRHARLLALVRRHDVWAWLEAQLADLLALPTGRLYQRSWETGPLA